MAANRLGKGTVDTNTKVVYTVPVDFVTIIKTISVCNIGNADLNLTVLLDDIPIIKNETINPDQVFNKSVFDHFLKSSESITIETDKPGDLTYYISGKEAVIDDIGDTKNWMRSVWDEWWQNDGPIMFEQDFNNWWQTSGPDNMEQNWQNWFDYIQNATYVDKNDFDIKMNEFQTKFDNLETDINQALLSIQDQIDYELTSLNSEFTFLENQLKDEIDQTITENMQGQSFRMWGEL